MGEKLPFNKKITSAIAAPFIGLLIVLMAAIAGVGGMAMLALGCAVMVAFGLASFMLMQGALTQISTMAVQAADIASEQLPDYVAEATSAHIDGASRVVQELGSTGDPDLDQLADAINRISYAAKGTADNYGALLKRGIGDVFVDLIRRNQTLLRRQLDFIDHLEADERDADRLESLFTLDHMTTQMQRNSDSILVLADADQRPLVGGTVALHDVVRAAQGEIADFNRVVVQAIDDASVDAATGIDLAHLLAELFENAATHAPDDTDVEVSGRQTDSGYMIVVRDHGPGMPQDRIHSVNGLLAEPPPVGLATTRWVGFNVVSRLSARLGTKVVVGHRHDGDDKAFAVTVGLPTRLLVAPAEPATQDWLKPAEISTPEPANDAETPERVPEASPTSMFSNATPVAEPTAPTPEPFMTPEPEPVAVAPEPFAVPTAVAQPQVVAQPEAVAQPQAVAQPEVVAQPAAVAQPAPVEPFPAEPMLETLPDAAEPIATPQVADDLISTFGDAPAPATAPVSFDGLAAFTEVATPASEPATPPVATPTADAALPDWLTTDYDEQPAEQLGLSRRTRTEPTIPTENGVNTELAGSIEALSDRSPEELRSVLSRYKSGRDAAGDEMTAGESSDGGLL